ncbi:MAG: hypothetical protein ACYC1M_05220 [Armatimonadota bacterium]
MAKFYVDGCPNPNINGKVYSMRALANTALENDGWKATGPSTYAKIIDGKQCIATVKPR